MDDARNKPVPRCFFECGRGIENFDDAVLVARALVGIDGLMARQGRIRHGGLFDFSQQAKLIFLNMNKQMAFHLAGGLESFFDSAWRQA